MSLLGAAEIRALAAQLDLKPAKALGQNFVIDANICRKIVKLANVTSTDIALEIGAGLGSLTLALLDQSAAVMAIEIDQRLAFQLPITSKSHSENFANLTVINEDALQVSQLPLSPTLLVANLPYNISVPVLLHYLDKFPTIRSGIVMVQAEVADRLVAKPGSKDYGIPSVKAAWWAHMSNAGSVSRSIFWPAPNVDSKLVAFERHEPIGDDNLRVQVFTVIDSAFSQRRKMLRSALKSSLGSSAVVQEVLEKAGIDPTLRGEALVVEEFARIARATSELGIES
jgi:16S rRNA (adenine1518-N6/adenine1519-N6)-dimethyltransferase